MNNYEYTLPSAAALDWFPEYVRRLGAFDVLANIGSRIVSDIESLISLGGLYSLISFAGVLITVWVMQVTTSHATWATSKGRLLWAKRITLVILACGLSLNILTPFIIPDPPWLSEIPVILGVMLILLLHGLEFRFNYVRYLDDDD